MCEDYRFVDNPRKRPIGVNYEKYEEIIYFNIKYTGFYKRIYFRNCEIINHSDFVVFFVNHAENSGAYKAMQHAIRKKKTIFNACSDFSF